METTEIVSVKADEFIEMALKNGANIDVIERFIALRNEQNARVAKQLFFDSLAKFQAECPEIPKTKKGHNYMFAPMNVIIRSTKDLLGKYGISYTFKPSMRPGKISVTCFITCNNHTETAEMEADADTTGSKNAIQALGSTVTYLERYTLSAALGISTSDDNDGEGKTMTFEEIEIKATSYESRSELTEYYRSLPKKWKDDPKVKVVFKNHEVFLKSK